MSTLGCRPVPAPAIVELDGKQTKFAHAGELVFAVPGRCPAGPCGG